MSALMYRRWLAAASPRHHDQTGFARLYGKAYLFCSDPLLCGVTRSIANMPAVARHHTAWANNTVCPDCKVRGCELHGRLRAGGAKGKKAVHGLGRGSGSPLPSRFTRFSLAMRCHAWLGACRLSLIATTALPDHGLNVQRPGPFYRPLPRLRARSTRITTHVWTSKHHRQTRKCALRVSRPYLLCSVPMCAGPAGGGRRQGPAVAPAAVLPAQQP